MKSADLKSEFNDKVQSLGTLLTDGASMVKLYPVLKEATSSSPQPTPGYLYHVMIEFSYRGRKNAEMLGEYLRKRLNRPSPHGVLKTLKCLQHLVDKGSPQFRQYLRSHDDELRSRLAQQDNKQEHQGSIKEETRSLAKKILKDLFNEELVQRDKVDENSEEHKMTSPTVSLTGMGNQTSTSSLSNTSQGGGFGNIGPRDQSMSITATIRDVMEQIVYAPDPKQELLESCLKGSVGDYEPVQMDLSPSTSTQQSVRRSQFGDGGSSFLRRNWRADDFDDNDDKIDDGESEDDLSEFCGLYGSTEKDDSGTNPQQNQLILQESQEFSGISAWCKQNGAVGGGGEVGKIVSGGGKMLYGGVKMTNGVGKTDFSQLQELLESLQESSHRGNIIHSLQYLLSTENDTTLLRTLIVLEKLLEKSILPPSIINQVFRNSLELKRLDGNKKVAMKSSKLLATLEFLGNYNGSRAIAI